MQSAKRDYSLRLSNLDAVRGARSLISKRFDLLGSQGRTLGSQKLNCEAVRKWAKFLSLSGGSDVIDGHKDRS